MSEIKNDRLDDYGKV